MKKNEYLLRVMDSLEKNPEQITCLSELSFESCSSYVSGLFLGISIESGVSLERDISKWFQERGNFKGSNMVWYAQFDLVNKNLNDLDKKVKFLNTIRDFFKENPSYFDR